MRTALAQATAGGALPAVQQSAAVQRYDGALRSAAAEQLQRLRPGPAGCAAACQTDAPPAPPAPPVPGPAAADLRAAVADLQAMQAALEEALRVQADMQAVLEGERAGGCHAGVGQRGFQLVPDEES